MKTILIILVSVLLTHCADKNSNNSNDSQAAINIGTEIAYDALTGTWKTACADNEIITDTFANKTQYRGLNQYTDANCTHLEARLDVKRTYVINQGDIDYTVASVSYTFLDQATLDECNRDACFGYTNWKLNVAKDVTGRAVDNASEPASKIGDKLYTIFKITGNALQYGDTSIKGYEGDDPVARPTTYTQLIFMKQQ